MDLGANEVTTFWKVTFPLILPGVLAAALLAFSLSIDDFVITNFVSGTTNTFPIWVYSIQRNALPVQINVIGSIIFLGAVGLVGRSRPPVRARAAHPHPLIAEHTGGPHGRHRCSAVDAAALPDHAVVPPGLEPDHEPRRRPRRGLVADHPRRRAVPRLLLGDRRHEHRPRPSAGRGGHRGPGARSCSTASRTSCITSRACGCTSDCRGLLPGGP